MTTRTTNGCGYSSHVVTVDLVPARADPLGGANMLSKHGVMCAAVSRQPEASLGKFDADESRVAYLETRLKSHGIKAAREQKHQDMGLFQVPLL